MIQNSLDLEKMAKRRFMVDSSSNSRPSGLHNTENSNSSHGKPIFLFGTMADSSKLPTIRVIPPQNSNEELGSGLGRASGPTGITGTSNVGMAVPIAPQPVPLKPIEVK